MQRFLDIIFSFIALLFLSPLLISIVILLKFTGEGEVFYLQERIGKYGKVFMLYKFATMLKNSPAFATGTITVKNDPRILPVGKFLRKTKINELPQLFNILFGDMSVIGPRPLTKETFSAYSNYIQETIKQVRPGLSGVGSIVFRGEEEILVGTNSSFNFYKEKIAPYKGALEVWYVNNLSLKNYLKAIFITVMVVLFPKSQIVWYYFKSLPVPSNELKPLLNYPDSI